MRIFHDNPMSCHYQCNFFHEVDPVSILHCGQPVRDEIFNPGFSQGVSGIGYAALLKAFPDEFPSVF